MDEGNRWSSAVVLSCAVKAEGFVPGIFLPFSKGLCVLRGTVCTLYCVSASLSNFLSDRGTCDSVVTMTPVTIF
jgi:hypothetical protein